MRTLNSAKPIVIKCFEKAAIASDDDRCSAIGAEIMKTGGSAVDAMIATMLCDGVVNPYHSGIGGATFFMVYGPKSEPTFINCREMAPAAATEEMFVGNPEAAQHGPLAIDAVFLDFQNFVPDSGTVVIFPINTLFSIVSWTKICLLNFETSFDVLKCHITNLQNKKKYFCPI